METGNQEYSPAWVVRWLPLTSFILILFKFKAMRHKKVGPVARKSKSNKQQHKPPFLPTLLLVRIPSQSFGIDRLYEGILASNFSHGSMKHMLEVDCGCCDFSPPLAFNSQWRMHGMQEKYCVAHARGRWKCTQTVQQCWNATSKKRFFTIFKSKENCRRQEWRLYTWSFHFPLLKLV